MAKMFYTMDETKQRLSLDEDKVRELSRLGLLREFRDGPQCMYKADQVEKVAVSQYGLSALEVAMPPLTEATHVVPDVKSKPAIKTPLHNPYENEKNSPYWDTVEQAIQNLMANDDLRVQTNTYFVIGYLVKQLENDRGGQK